MHYKIITPPTYEPVTLSEAKNYIKLTDEAALGDTADDDVVRGLITAAREYCESITSRAFATQTVEAYLDRFPCGDIELPLPPLQSVTSVKYKDYTGAETTMTAGMDYLVDLDSNVGRIVRPYGVLWPSFTAYPVNPIKITYVTGYGIAPQKLKLAMLLLIGHWNTNREATGTATQEIAHAVSNMLAQARVRWF